MKRGSRGGKEEGRKGERKREGVEGQDTLAENLPLATRLTMG